MIVKRNVNQGESMIKSGDGKGLSVQVEESKKRIVENPEYILQMDNVVMKNGTQFVVTHANQTEIELMATSRWTIKKEGLPAFLSDVKHIVRADCFEVG
jgi:hypothetical protein